MGGSTVYTCRYSRRIIWLKVGVTNNKPEVIAHHFIESVLAMEGIYARSIICMHELHVYISSLKTCFMIL